MIFANTLEKGRTLRNHLAILLPCLVIAWLHLAETAIEKAPPLFGRTINQVQVSRGKQHHLQLPYQFDCLLRNAVDLDTLALRTCRHRHCPV